MDEDALEKVLTRVLDRQVTKARQAGSSPNWWQQARVQHGHTVAARALLEDDGKWFLRIVNAVAYVLDERGLTGDGAGGGPGDWEEVAAFIADATREAIREELPAVLTELDVELPGDLEAVINEGLARRILSESGA